MAGFGVYTLDGTDATRLAYDNAGTLTVVPNNDFVIYHVFGMIDSTNQYIRIMGQDTHTTRLAARNAVSDEINDLLTNGLPFAEMIPIGSMIFQTSNGYGNGVKARSRQDANGQDYVDFRGSKLSPSVGATDHGSLAGLGDDDHAQYFDSVRIADGTLTALQFSTGVEVDRILDEDAMGSDLATALATQQSIKKYTDDTMTTHESAYTHSDIALNTTHRTSNGTDHTYIDQDVTTSGTPSFQNLTLTEGVLTVEGITAGGDSTIEMEKTASGDNSYVKFKNGATPSWSILHNNLDQYILYNDALGLSAYTVGPADNKITMTGRLQINHNASGNALTLLGNSLGDAEVLCDRDAGTDTAQISFEEFFRIGLQGGQNDMSIRNVNLSTDMMTFEYTSNIVNILSSLELTSGTGINEFSIDGTLAGDSDDAVPTEKAVKLYADTKMTTHEAVSDGNHSDVGSNTTHRTSNGSDHTYIDQAVTVAGAPQFAYLGIGQANTADAVCQMNYTGGRVCDIIRTESTTNTTDRALELYRATTGTAGNGIGVELGFNPERSDGDPESAAALVGILNDVANHHGTFRVEMASDSSLFTGLEMVASTGDALISTFTGDVRTSTAPTNGNDLCNKTYTDGLITTHEAVSDGNHSDVGTNTTHRTSNGTDHTYIDQDITVASTPQFAALGVGKANDTSVPLQIRKEDGIGCDIIRDTTVLTGGTFSALNLIRHTHVTPANGIGINLSFSAQTLVSVPASATPAVILSGLLNDVGNVHGSFRVELTSDDSLFVALDMAASTSDAVISTFQGDVRTATAPTNGNDLCNKTYTDGLITTHEAVSDGNHSDVGANTTHRTSNGTNHTYINQSVTTTSTPTFGELYITGKTNGDFTINSVQAIRIPDQTSFDGTLIVGDGGSSLSHSTATDGFYNTCVGITTGDALTIGHSNSLVGYGAGDVITTGIQNTCLGYNAGSAITTSAGNSFFGFNSGLLCTGVSNSGLGKNTLRDVTTGENNSAIGDQALLQVGSGDRNVGIGVRAGWNATGDDNVFIGYRSGYNYTGSDNLFIGNEADGGTNANTWIRGGSGYELYFPAVYADTVTSARDLEIQSDGKIGYVSSIRESKMNIEDLNDTSFLHSLNPVKFNYRKKLKTVDVTVDDSDPENPMKNKEITIKYLNEVDSTDIQYGLIAEDVEAVDTNLVFYDAENNLAGVHYKKLIPPMLKEIQNLKNEHGFGEWYIENDKNGNLIMQDTEDPGGIALKLEKDTGLVYAPKTYDSTVTGGRDLEIQSDGKIGYSSSIRASKMNINDLRATKWIYDLNPVTFNYRKTVNREYSNIPVKELEFGLIAEDVKKICPNLVFENDTGGVFALSIKN